MAYRVYSRAEWGARPPRRAHFMHNNTGAGIIHYTASDITPAGRRESTSTPPPKRPGPKWYKIWRTPHRTVAERLRRINVSRKIRAYNRAYKKWQKNTKLGPVDPKIVAREKSIMRVFQNYHMDNNGWKDIGYHYVVFASGNIYRGRPATGAKVAGGAHTINANHQLGLAHVMTKGQKPTDHMIAAGKQVLLALGITKLRGHRQVPGNSTFCPGDQLSARYNL